MTDTPIPGVPTQLTSANNQLNITGAAAPYTVIFPAGVDSANPCGVRNVGLETQLVTMEPAPGDVIWDWKNQTGQTSFPAILESGKSAMFCFYPAMGWVPYLFESPNIIELWQATPITGIGTPSVVQWTFVPLSATQTPTFFTEAAGVFTYARPARYSVSVTFSLEMAFVAAANNVDATYSVDLEDVAVVDPSLFIRDLNSFQSTRSGNFPVSGRGSGIIQGTQGDTYRVLANLEANTGAMTVDIDAGLLQFEIS
jgi:hypothetical protein